MDSTEGKKEKETRKILSEKIPEFRNAITHLTHLVKKRATDGNLWHNYYLNLKNNSLFPG